MSQRADCKKAAPRARFGINFAPSARRDTNYTYIYIMSIKQIPVLLLTGYLGSGKTTLVNKILANKKGIKFAVIVNDIGEVNIDADLIQQGGVVNKKDDSLVALQNGCICCTLKMDLVEQIREIIEMGRFDYIVIEASGICEPAPIAQTICSIPSMGPQYIKGGIARLDCIVTVVDALRMKDEFGNGDNLQRGNLDEDDLEKPGHPAARVLQYHPAQQGFRGDSLGARPRHPDYPRHPAQGRNHTLRLWRHRA